MSYNGKYPPTQLFADLEMIGWTPPAPAPPPRKAIDWETPNPETGEPFSIRDYNVEDTVTAPVGSGDRGRWTDGERAAYLRGLDGVLKRHDLLAAPPPPAAPLPPPPAATLPPPPAASPEPSVATPVAAGEGAPASGGAAPGSTLVHLDAILTPGARQLAIEAMRSLDIPARVEVREVTKTVQFRGSTSTATETGHVLTAILASTELPRVTAVLVNANAVMNEDALVVSALKPETLASFLAPAPATEPAAPSAPPTDRSTVTILVRANAFEFFADAIGGTGGTIVQRAQAALTTRMNHRGSVRQMTVPGVKVTIEIVPDRVSALLTAAAECGVDIDDPAHVHVVGPAPAPVEAADTAELARRLLAQEGAESPDDGGSGSRLLEQVRAVIEKATAAEPSGASHEPASLAAP